MTVFENELKNSDTKEMRIDFICEKISNYADESKIKFQYVP